MSLKFEKKPYFMPVFFSGEGEHGINDTTLHEPADINVISLTYETDREALESRIPDCYELLEPYVNIKFCEFFGCSWLAGKGYTLINVSCPVRFKGERDDMVGDLVLVMFENHADPIIGGRDSMGYAKYYAEIPLIEKLNGKYSCKASAWGKPFLEMTVDTNIKADEADIEEIKKVEGRTQGKFQYKYIPKVREKDEPYEDNYTTADCAYPVVLPAFEKPDDYPYDLGASESEWGMGSIKLTPTAWEDWPHGHLIGAGLASLEVKRIIAARHFTYKDPGVYYTCYILR